MMRRSLAKLRRLPPETRVYCAHEYTLSNLAFATSVAPDDAAIQRRLADCQQLRAADRPTVPSSIQEECASNPFLRWDDPAIYQALKHHDKATSDDHDAVFAALREWKDKF
jgi:hydroxyacylglutathione hydrolase